MVYFRWSRLITLKGIRDKWGQAEIRKRDFKSIALFHQSNDVDDTKALVDDKTWDDLNMNDIYVLLDRTITNLGESALYNIRRTPCTPDSAQELKHRSEFISLLQKDAKARSHH